MADTFDLYRVTPVARDARGYPTGYTAHRIFTALPHHSAYSTRNELGRHEVEMGSGETVHMVPAGQPLAHPMLVQG